MTRRSSGALEASGRSYVLNGVSLAVPAAEPGLHVVATPIGNLDDITLRGLKTLAGVDVIACEDTRVTAKLLQRYGMKVPLISYHEHNAKARGHGLLKRLGSGGSVALVSDAGTPLVSDPGAQLIADAIEAGITIIPVPGASSVLAALTGAGLPAERFTFVGFLPPKHSARCTALKAIENLPGTLVVFETAPRLNACLQDMLDVLGNRGAAICRELTKLHETILRGSLGDLLAQLEDKTLKGEIVLVLGPALETDAPVIDLDALLIPALKKLSLKEAVAAIASQTGLPRRDVYARALELKA